MTQRERYSRTNCSVARRRVLRHLRGLSIASIAIAAIACAGLSGPAVAASGKLEHEFLLFPTAHVEVRPNAHDPNAENETEVSVGVNAVYSLHFDRYRFLGELLTSNEELELERIQLGTRLFSNTMLWLGRFHTPLGFWNTEYHHGAYYQTTIHRPSIAEYEDEGGVMPNHISGALFEGRKNILGEIIDFAFSTGLAPVLHGTLEPFGHAHTEFEEHGLTTTLRLGRRADEFTASHHGVFINKTRINTEQKNLHYIEQWIAGAYLHQVWMRTRFTTTAFYVRPTIVKNDSSSQSSFVSGYLNLEYEVNDKWMVFARLENSYGADNDPYLDLFTTFVSERYLAGWRFDFMRHQAITFEAASMTRGNDSHLHFSFQWSAVYP